ncbi:Uncharacterised protein [Mycobacteroides abscessus]|nr:Uncharacterised protein [Mycobacteroides abscessus]
MTPSCASAATNASAAARAGSSARGAYSSSVRRAMFTASAATGAT